MQIGDAMAADVIRSQPVSWRRRNWLLAAVGILPFVAIGQMAWHAADIDCRTRPIFITDDRGNPITDNLGTPITSSGELLKCSGTVAGHQIELEHVLP